MMLHTHAHSHFNNDENLSKYTRFFSRPSEIGRMYIVYVCNVVCFHCVHDFHSFCFHNKCVPWSFYSVSSYSVFFSQASSVNRTAKESYFYGSLVCECVDLKQCAISFVFQYRNIVFEYMYA